MRTPRPLRSIAVMGLLAAVLALSGCGGLGSSATGSSTTTPSASLDRIPAHLLPRDAPVPVSPEILRVTNSWIVSDGVTLLEVCAGAAGHDRHTGRLFLLRQDNRSGQQKLDSVDVPHAGALSIVDPPTGAAVETSAQHGTLSFVGHAGIKGTLDLTTDTVTLE
jgi:hypothetical protein